MKQIFTSLSILFLLFGQPFWAAAQCTSNAGMLPFFEPIDECWGSTLVLDNTEGEFLDANDTLMYILDTSPIGVGTIVAQSYEAVFEPNANLQPNVTYYLKALVGDKWPTGVWINDPCLSISNVVPVVLHLPDISVQNCLLSCANPTCVLTATSTAPNVEFYWSNGAIGPTFGTVTAPGAYTCTVEDGLGCTNTAVGLVQLDAVLPLVTATFQNISCSADIQLFAVATDPNATFQWTGPNGFISTQASPLVPNAPQGIYTVTVVNANGCSSSTALTVIFPAPLSVSAKDAFITCNDPTPTLVVENISLNWSFAWTGPGINVANANIPNPKVSTVGTYTVVVTELTTGCTASDTVAVTAAANALSLDIQPIKCFNQRATIAILNSAGLQIQWHTGPTTGTLTNLPAGIYCVTVTNPALGCMVDSCIVITAPSAPLALPIVVPTAVNCFGGSTGAINIDVSGGTPPYVYQWQGTNFTASTEDLTGIKAGNYKVSITDANGCSLGSGNILVSQTSAISISSATLVITHPTCKGSADGALDLLPTGGTPPYQYLWSNGSTTTSINNLHAGPYSLTVTDANGCTGTRSFQLVEPPPVSDCISIILSLDPVDCHPTINITSNCILTFTWSNGNTSPTLVQPAPGTYEVTVTDVNGCSAVLPPIVVPQYTACGQINGQLTGDANANCLNDPLEPGLAHWIVRAVNTNGQAFYAMTDTAGHYAMGVPVGDFTVEVVPLGAAWDICDNGLAVSVVQQGSAATANFVAFATNNCPQMRVDLSAPLLRRCFDNNFYFLSYSNIGTVTAENAEVVLTLDPFLSIVSALKPYVSIGNNQYRFDLGNVAPGETDQFWVKVLVSCNALIGQTHCSEAHIYPDTLCHPVNPLWSGAQVDVNAVCEGDSLLFTLKNTGTAVMNSPLEYIVIEDGVMLRAAQEPPLAVGDSMTVKVPANGSTWRMEAEQEAYHPAQSMPTAVVEGCTVTGLFSTGYVTQFPLNDNDYWIATDCTPNVGSWDPNDKQGMPLGYGADHYIRPGTDIEYLIRFQNTGTDTAFNIVVRDTLSPWLDPASIRLGASSHPFEFDLNGLGYMAFSFKNILLPDSNTNETLSHGFLQYRISQKQNVPLETDIRNRAGIYFDFNAPVITNTTVHRVGINFISVGLWQPAQPQYAVRVAPQPFDNEAWLEVTGLTGAKDLQLQIVDPMGRLQQEMTTQNGRFLVKRAGMAEGIYYFKVTQNGQLVGNGKLVVGAF